MSNKILLKNYIRNMILEISSDTGAVPVENELYPVEAPLDAPLGNYAFPKERLAAGYEDIPTPPEEDTEYEKKLLNALILHIGGANKALEPEHVQMIKYFLDNGLYKKVFRHPESGQKFYRGEAVKTVTLKRWLGLGPDDKIPVKKETPNLVGGPADVNFVIRSKIGAGYASSWSTNENTPWAFANSQSIEGNPKKHNYWAVVMEAAPGQENKFVAAYPTDDNPRSGLYKFLPNVGNSKHEAEVISLEPIIVSKIRWKVYQYNYDRYVDEFGKWG